MAEEQQNKQQYPFYIHDQYIKDLSFENPNILLKYSDTKSQPAVSVNVETHVSKVNNDTYEVTLKALVNSNLENNPVFVVDLTYGALVSVDPTLKSDMLESILLVHVPFLMFPFIRQIIADVTRNGSYPPLLIEPIDFAALYLRKKSETNHQHSEERNGDEDNEILTSINKNTEESDIIDSTQMNQNTIIN